MEKLSNFNISEQQSEFKLISGLVVIGFFENLFPAHAENYLKVKNNKTSFFH